MSGKNFNILSLTFVSVSIAFLWAYPFYCIGFKDGVKTMKLEAVKRKHAIWEVDEKGEKYFKWNEVVCYSWQKNPLEKQIHVREVPNEK